MKSLLRRPRDPKTKYFEKAVYKIRYVDISMTIIAFISVGIAIVEVKIQFIKNKVYRMNYFLRNYKS